MLMNDKLPQQKDKVIADTGWGIKPDDQPANRSESAAASDVYHYDPRQENVVAAILRLQRRGFNTANKVRVEPGRTVITDINGDPFEIVGLSWGDPNLIDVLQELGAAFDPQQIRELPPGYPERREYALGRVWAWGAERSGG